MEEFIAKYWIEFLLGLASGAIVFALKWLFIQFKALKNGMQAILRDRILQAYNHYHDDKGYMPIYAKDNIEHMYKEYHNLGGNGTITELYNKMMALKTKPPEEESEA